MPRTAVGIPDRDVYGDPTSLTPGQMADWVVQEHLARRAGRHFDVRFGTPETGLHSWAVRYGLPPPGGRHLAIQQPLHSHDYRNFEGEIPSGYGAGQVRQHAAGRVLITHVEPGAVHFTTATGRFPERYVLTQGKGKKWLLLNTTPTQAVPYEKVHYSSVPAEKAKEVFEGLQPGSSVQAKVDGAASLTKLLKDHVEVVSYRRAKNTGYPIIHTERVFHGRPRTAIPRELVGSILRGELYGAGEGGAAIPPQALGGILNSGVGKSIEDQRSRNVRLKNMLFDVHQLGNQTTANMPYADRLARLREIVKHLPPDVFHLPEEATTPQAAQELFSRIQSGQHPLTHEGVVIHPATGKPSKLKLFKEHDVHLREIFPGEGKYQGTHAGGFRYSHEPTGPIMGEVGTGLSDEMRKDMWENQDTYLGRLARVQAQDKFPSGALRAPSFLALHEDYPNSMAAVKALDGLGTARSRTSAQRQVGPSVTPHVRNALVALQKAKVESDRRNYDAKHALVRQAIADEPHNFIIDSEANGVAGLTHVPTSFQIHLPSTVVPDALRARKEIA